MTSSRTRRTRIRPRRECQNKDEVRGEPVFFLAFIQHDLQRADAQREIADAPVVNAAFSALDVWRIVNKSNAMMTAAIPIGMLM